MREQLGPRGGGATRGIAIFAAVLALSVALLAAGPVHAQKINMDFKGADIRDVLQMLGELGGFNVLTDRDVGGTVTVYLRDMDVREAVDLVIKMSGYDHVMVGNTLVVATSQRLTDRFVRVDTRFFAVEHLDPATLVSPLQFALPGVSVQPDPVGKGVLVRGDEEQLARAAAFIRERDVPRAPQLDFVDADTLTILRSLAIQGGYNLIASEFEPANHTVFLQGLQIAEAIAVVSRQAGLKHVFEGSNLYVTPMVSEVSQEREPAALGPTADDSPAQRGQPADLDEAQSSNAPSDDEVGEHEPVAPVAEPIEMTRLFDVHYIDLKTAADIASLVVPRAALRTEVSARKLMIRGTAEQLDDVEALLQEQDRPDVRLEGIVVGADGSRAILSVNGTSYVVREGSRAAGLYVVRISEQSAVVRTAHDRQFQVFIGGGE